MYHIITTDEFFNCGLPVSDDITSAEVEFAVNTVEQYFLYPYLKELLSDIIENPTQYEDVLEAADGLKQALYHLTFAYLIYDKIRLTRYSSVIKNDEHSTDPAFSQVRDIASTHWEIGTSFLLRDCEKLEIDIKKVKRNDLIFNELSYKL